MEIREAREDEHAALGALLVQAYAGLEGFPRPHQQPRYYAMLADVGRFARMEQVSLLVAASAQGALAGGVVYFGSMREYGGGGIAGTIPNASGLRLLAVAPAFRGGGVGRALTLACIERARQRRHAEVILHTTQAMRVAWHMYERLGFRRAQELDFLQEDLQVFGFRLALA